MGGPPRPARSSAAGPGTGPAARLVPVGDPDRTSGRGEGTSVQSDHSPAGDRDHSRHRSAPPPRGGPPLRVRTVPTTRWTRFGIPPYGVLFLFAATSMVIATLGLWSTAGDVSYCSPPDHSGPCTRYQDSASLAHLGGVTCLLLVAVAGVLCGLSVRFARPPGRTRPSVLCALGSFVPLAGAVAVFLYGAGH